MNNIKYIDFIVNQADKKIYEIKEKGYIPGGSNGPYNDNETPLRLSSHWILIYSWLYKRYQNKKYLKCIEILSEYLYHQKIHLFDDKFTFCSRSKEGKDHVNGTIGAAWIIEGLVEATNVLKDEKYYNLAVKVFLSHPFNKKIGCWNRYDIDGKKLGYDETFNHQLWLAAAGSEILGYKENKAIEKQINRFLDKTLDNRLFRIHNNGLIKHFSFISDNFRHIVGFFKNHYFKDYAKKNSLIYKEEGYHYFALYGFAILKNNFSNHPIFKSKKLKNAIEYALNKENYIKQINRNPEEDGTGLAQKLRSKTNVYCFTYNSPSFELPFIIKQFNNSTFNNKLIDELWTIQKKITMNKDGNLTKDVYDSETLTARIYELLRAI